MNNKVRKLIQNKSQVQQRTVEWHMERKKLITATDAASALEANPYKTKIDLLHQKCEPFIEEGVVTNSAMTWGTKYEPVAVQLYEKFENDKVHELGLLKHPKYKWLAASPDGIRLNGKLVEIKCVYNRKIREEEPYMYWIQVQIQLEVCNLDECDLFQCKFFEFKNKNDYIEDKSNQKGISMDDKKKEFYWKLEEYSCKTIVRDKEWFKKSLPILYRFHNDVISFQRLQKSKRKREDYSEMLTNSKRTRSSSFDEYKSYDWSTWVSATETKNYMLNDPLLDWLNMYGGKLNLVSDKKKNTTYDFNEYIMNKGKEFEKAIFKNLQNRFKQSIVNVANSYEGYSTYKLHQTIEYMKQGIPFICHGVLHNKENNTYGIPDLIVRSDYLNEMTQCDNITEDESSVGCLFNANWHYRIVEIKYTTLKTNNNYIYNSGNIPCYKSQAIIYNEALSVIQKYNPNSAYLFGRKIESNHKYIGFYKLGQIFMNDKDNKLKEKTIQAIEWMKDLKTNGLNWNINPPSRTELYPNMCNTFDYPWHDTKKEIANKIKDITILWKCGTMDRKTAFNKNIFKWKDRRCNSSVLGFKNKNAIILDNIIDINKQYKNKIDTSHVKQIFNSGESKRSKRDKIEFYVDFETCSDINDNFDKYVMYNNELLKEESFNNTLIFMIGIGWIHPKSGKWIFKSFVTDVLTSNEEERIMKEWIDYMKDISYKYNNKKKPVVYHWSPAEVSCYESSIGKYNINYTIKWKDLLQEFKQYPITLKGVFNYGLKNIAKMMYKNNMITTSWEDSEMDGLGAMVATWNCNNMILQESEQKSSKLTDFDEMKEIAKYNEIDCKVLWDINTYIKSL